MAKFTLAVSTLLVASAAVSAHEGHDHSSSTHDEHEHSGSAASGTVGSECSADVSEAFIATVDNSTYFETCAEGMTFNITSVFDVLNFTDSEFLTFCNSSTCLEPVHGLMGSVDCLITYQGTPRDLAAEVDKLHDQCHEVLDAADLEMDMGGHAHSSGSTGSASGSSDAPSVVVTLGSVVSAAILAAFLA
uniref:Elicitin n=1 Tax=Phytophthora infestans TaxID=4787 RepID=Q2N0E6_PHYIN|nr:elicitin-like protein INL11B [Phytophthora infestans]